MTTYIVTYDLSNEADYPALYTELKATKYWARINESVWAVVTDETAAQLRDRLLTVLNDEQDRLFVIKSGVEAAWKNVVCSNDWLKKWL